MKTRNFLELEFSKTDFKGPIEIFVNTGLVKSKAMSVIGSQSTNWRLVDLMWTQHNHIITDNK